MIIKGVYERDIRGALDKANEQFKGNLEFKRFDLVRWDRHQMPVYAVTLRVRDSCGPGARRTVRGWKMISACWHAHGTFIDALPESAEILSAGRKSRPKDCWYDWNAGSIMDPWLMSELCECGGIE